MPGSVKLRETFLKQKYNKVYFHPDS